MDEQRWRDPAWLAEVDAWVDAQLAGRGSRRSGPSEQSHVTVWSTVLRVPTTDGDVWFKANDVSMRHEGALVELLAEECPVLVAAPLATDHDRGWLLSPDAGESLRSVSPRVGTLDHWLTLLPAYAEAQLRMVPHVDRLIALGVPDRRLAALPTAYARLVEEVDAAPRFREAVGLVEDLCERLAAFEIDETLNHDDLHDGQVHLRDGQLRILDWGDACVSHPFFTLSVTLQGVLSWGLDDVENSVDTTPFRDAYLAPFRERWGGDLAAACDVAMRLGWACRAVNGHVSEDPGATQSRLAMFLDGHV
jgi:hypothetical protein